MSEEKNERAQRDFIPEAGGSCASRDSSSHAADWAIQPQVVTTQFYLRVYAASMPHVLPR